MTEVHNAILMTNSLGNSVDRPTTSSDIESGMTSRAESNLDGTTDLFELAKETDDRVRLYYMY